MRAYKDPPTQQMHPLIEVRDVSKVFSRRHAPPVAVLSELDFSVVAGQSHSILGKSGSGKSTLIHIMAGFDCPSSGHVWWQGNPVSSLSIGRIDRARRQMFGFVHQHHHLLSDMTALDNIAMPLRIDGLDKRTAMRQGHEWLERIGLSDRANHMPGELSGGERQRVGIARALVNNPRLIIADEPTGNLDRATSASIMALLESLQQETAAALVLVTHDTTIAASTQFQWVLQEGKLWDPHSATFHPPQTPPLSGGHLQPSG